MTHSEVEKEIDGMDQELIDAVKRQDAASLDRLIADDFLIVGESLGNKLGDKKLYVGDCLASGPINEIFAEYGVLCDKSYLAGAFQSTKGTLTLKASGAKFSGTFEFTAGKVKDESKTIQVSGSFSDVAQTSQE